MPVHTWVDFCFCFLSQIKLTFLPYTGIFWDLQVSVIGQGFPTPKTDISSSSSGLWSRCVSLLHKPLFHHKKYLMIISFTWTQSTCNNCTNDAGLLTFPDDEFTLVLVAVGIIDLFANCLKKGWSRRNTLKNTTITTPQKIYTWIYLSPLLWVPWLKFWVILTHIGFCAI